MAATAPESAGPLTAHLLCRAHDVTPHEHRTRFHRQVAWLRSSAGSMVLVAVILVFISRELSLEPVLYGTYSRYLVGSISCIQAKLIYRYRWRELRDVFVRAAQIASVLERGTNTGSRVRLERTARHCNRVVKRFQLLCAATVITSSIDNYNGLRWDQLLALLLVRVLSISEDQTKENVETAFKIASWPLKWVVAATFNVGFYAIIACFVVMPTVLATFYQEVSHAVEDRPASYQWAVVQRATLEASMDMERMAFTALPAVLVMVYVMPILCTIEVLVLSNEAELFSYVTASHVLTLLLPMCMAGDLLSRLRNGVCNGAYNGPWTEERPSGRRFRLQMMQSSFGVAGRLRGVGIGVLDRRSCLKALRSWYNFVQLFHNIGFGAPH